MSTKSARFLPQFAYIRSELQKKQQQLFIKKLLVPALTVLAGGNHIYADRKWEGYQRQ